MAVYISKHKKGTKHAIRMIVNAFAKEIDFSKGVFLKPNIVFPVKETSGQITRHVVVRTLVEILREKKPGIDIVLGEGVAAGAVAKKNFYESGYTRLSYELGVPLLDLDLAERVKVKWGYGSLKLPKIVLNRTYINLPILKKSSAALFSGAMKNQKGLILPKMKKAFHKMGLHKPLAELNKAIQPNLTIMDCTYFSCEDLFIASDNTYEADMVAVKFLGIFEPEYIKIARKLAIGNYDCNIMGEPIGTAVLKRPMESNEEKKFLRLRFNVSHRTCSMCRYLFQDVKNIKNGNFFLNLFFYLKLMRYAFSGAEIILGCKSNVLSDSKNVICVGDCTRKLSKEQGYIHIPGCPPKKQDILKTRF